MNLLHCKRPSRYKLQSTKTNYKSRVQNCRRAMAPWQQWKLLINGCTVRLPPRGSNTKTKGGRAVTRSAKQNSNHTSTSRGRVAYRWRSLQTRAAAGEVNAGNVARCQTRRASRERSRILNFSTGASNNNSTRVPDLPFRNPVGVVGDGVGGDVRLGRRLPTDARARAHSSHTARVSPTRRTRQKTTRPPSLLYASSCKAFRGYQGRTDRPTDRHFQ